MGGYRRQKCEARKAEFREEECDTREFQTQGREGSDQEATHEWKSLLLWGQMQGTFGREQKLAPIL